MDYYHLALAAASHLALSALFSVFSSLYLEADAQRVSLPWRQRSVQLSTSRLPTAPMNQRTVRLLYSGFA